MTRFASSAYRSPSTASSALLGRSLKPQYPPGALQEHLHGLVCGEDFGPLLKYMLLMWFASGLFRPQVARRCKQEEGGYAVVCGEWVGMQVQVGVGACRWKQGGSGGMQVKASGWISGHKGVM